MITKLLSLLCFRLCVGQGDAEGPGPLPRPVLTAWPSSVVPEEGNVTLTCRTPVRELLKFVLRRRRGFLWKMASPECTEGLAEFHLTALRLSDAAEYSCDYHRKEGPKVKSPESNVLVLLVTGYFPKPSLQARLRGEVAAGENVTLQCQQPSHVNMSTSFALLKAGEPTPTQVLTSLKGGASFSLRTVTVGDSGSYSCVYYRAQSPFLTSQPSDPLSVQVAVSPGTTSEDYTMVNAIRLGLAALIVVIIGVFLVDAWWGQKSPPGSRPRSCPGEG